MDSTSEDVRAACTAAADAASDLAQLPLVERSALLRRAAGVLTDAGTEIIRIADEETHLGPLGTPARHRHYFPFPSREAGTPIPKDRSLRTYREISPVAAVENPSVFSTAPSSSGENW